MSRARRRRGKSLGRKWRKPRAAPRRLGCGDTAISPPRKRRISMHRHTLAAPHSLSGPRVFESWLSDAPRDLQHANRLLPWRPSPALLARGVKAPPAQHTLPNVPSYNINSNAPTLSPRFGSFRFRFQTHTYTYPWSLILTLAYRFRRVARMQRWVVLSSAGNPPQPTGAWEVTCARCSKWVWPRGYSAGQYAREDA